MQNFVSQFWFRSRGETQNSPNPERADYTSNPSSSPSSSILLLLSFRYQTSPLTSQRRRRRRLHHRHHHARRRRLRLFLFTKPHTLLSPPASGLLRHCTFPSGPYLREVLTDLTSQISLTCCMLSAEFDFVDLRCALFRVGHGRIS